ncbi:alkyl hydroperoxide reductase subunit F [Saccharophagus degradans]|uniref:alkyl hydroperoxide reductase subunit F n=1 Tax=Saccharophagus degradans TaxID=86304 RepID=UPI0024781086|nr:alkyl hydroperoxide reductase subunit F [Saccharophagus degradans]WGO99743.1 alkyl hydroperoxide reductase subunit F [Saccharophagus degradans]
MLDQTLINQLKQYVQHIKRPVELVLTLNRSDKSEELQALGEQLASLSDLISLQIDAASSKRSPTLLVRSPDTKSEIRFSGIPLGHEFTSLVLALLHTGGHDTKQEQAILEQIKTLKLPNGVEYFEFETYISLSCQNCPEVVQALNILAAINPQIKHTMIDGALFEQEVSERKVMAVPSVFLNGKLFGQGRMNISQILAKLDSGSAEKQKNALNEKPNFDMLIVGGGPAGASAAIYAARKGIKTGIAAERFGGQVADTLAIENFISVKATEGPKLVSSLESHVRDYDVDIMQGQQAAKLTPASESQSGLIEITLTNGAVLKSRSVLLATGARWRELGVPGEQEYRGKGVAYCPHCDGPLFKGKPVAVIGGGNSGVEAAIDLAGITSHVTLLEFGETLRADDVLVRKLKSLPNVKIITSAQTTEVHGDGEKVTGLRYTNRETNIEHSVALAGVFVQIGLIPNSEWLGEPSGNAVKRTRYGEIETNSKGETSVPGVFAAGDVTTAPYKQIIVAMGSGASAALGAFDYLMRQETDESKSVAA